LSFFTFELDDGFERLSSSRSIFILARVEKYKFHIIISPKNGEKFQLPVFVGEGKIQEIKFSELYPGFQLS
jgi:hypothetical protein